VELDWNSEQVTARTQRQGVYPDASPPVARLGFVRHEGRDAPAEFTVATAAGNGNNATPGAGVRTITPLTPAETLRAAAWVVDDFTSLPIACIPPALADLKARLATAAAPDLPPWDPTLPPARRPD
jgi:hypothetical protein